MEPEGLRAEFPVLRQLAYLNAGSDGPIPRRAAAATAARLEREAVNGRSGASHHTELEALVDRTRGLLAALVGASPGEIALTRSTTDGVHVVLSGLDLGPGDEVLTTTRSIPVCLLRSRRFAGAPASSFASSPTFASKSPSRRRRG